MTLTAYRTLTNMFMPLPSSRAEARCRRLQGHELFASVCKTTKRRNRAIIAFTFLNRVVDDVKVRMHRFDNCVLGNLSFKVVRQPVYLE